MIKTANWHAFGTFSLNVDAVYGIRLFHLTANENDMNHIWQLVERDGNDWKPVTGEMASGYSYTTAYDSHELQVWNELNSPLLDLQKYCILFTYHSATTPLAIDHVLQRPVS
ncbi:uncharacterized protein PSFLO_04135 [Pseudozyma flocculosa]|uniref:Uncharacterized protein n=2 Tax=Pseudozyma flocculosa TaxID=84751 RepID=A0A5C3F401_9BASI|nr:uncharacterized protein PSFLO_04135 [Pseudozyma flocculosa]